ncbi:MAG: LysR substrate-binding domain-containing protein, partial [Boseongicola sp.]|nr:LysR substrate-binding domain-containing protein [Boseongicola sp.]
GLDGRSPPTLVPLAGAGLGVTLLPEMAVRVETRSAPVRVSRFSSPTPRRSVGMIWRKTNPLTEQLTQVADIVRETALELRKEKSRP